MGGDRRASFADIIFKPSDVSHEEREFEPNLVFIIMAFKRMQKVYSVIKDECSKLGLTAKRVDENVGSDFIIREIYDLIQSAEFIICDLTYERPNIYYELGYAHGVGNLPIDILLVAKEGTNLHFDIAPLRVQYYGSAEHLRSIVKSNLEAMIKKTRKRRKTPNNSFNRTRS
jgi:hypothetical protein